MCITTERIAADNTAIFPVKLMKLLDSEDFPDTISWLPNGLGFIILDKKKFESIVMPMYFKQSKYTSFTRRLNRWEFIIREHGHKKASYYHPLFKRGDTESCLKMNPIPQKYKKRPASRNAVIQTTKVHSSSPSLVQPIIIPSSEHVTNDLDSNEDPTARILIPGHEFAASNVQLQDGVDNFNVPSVQNNTELVRSPQFHSLYVQSLLHEYSLHQANLARAGTFSFHALRQIKHEIYQTQLRMAQHASTCAFKIALLQSMHGL